MKGNASSFYQLAQIFIILAGFSLTVFGILFNGYISTYNSSAIGVNQIIMQHEAINQTGANLDFVYNKLYPQFVHRQNLLKDYSFVCLALGISFTIASFIFWDKGSKFS